MARKGREWTFGTTARGPLFHAAVLSPGVSKQPDFTAESRSLVSVMVEGRHCPLSCLGRGGGGGSVHPRAPEPSQFLLLPASPLQPSREETVTELKPVLPHTQVVSVSLRNDQLHMDVSGTEKHPGPLLWVWGTGGPQRGYPCVGPSPRV